MLCTTAAGKRRDGAVRGDRRKERMGALARPGERKAKGAGACGGLEPALWRRDGEEQGRDFPPVRAAVWVSGWPRVRFGGVGRLGCFGLAGLPYTHFFLLFLLFQKVFGTIKNKFRASNNFRK